MSEVYRVLAIHPKSDVIQFAFYMNEHCIFENEVVMSQSYNEMPYNKIEELVIELKDAILEELLAIGIQLSAIDAVVSRGGLLRPISGGTYRVDIQMVKDLKAEHGGKHPANLGGLIAYEIHKQLQVKPYIVDPVVVDEMSEVAKTTGLPEIKRQSIFHALSQKQAARKVADELGISYEHAHIIVVHIGSGISVGIHEKSRVTDVNNGLHGEGPIAPERAGSLPAGTLIDLCYSGNYSREEIIEKISLKGGLTSYLQTGNLKEINERVISGDKHAQQLFHVMAYQVAKEVGSLATVTYGEIDGIVLTGNIQKDMIFIKEIIDRVKWIADVFVFPGENVLDSLAAGALRILRNIENEKLYKDALLLKRGSDINGRRV